MGIKLSHRYARTSALVAQALRIWPGLRVWLSLLHVLPYLNCAINPFIYAFFNSSFRDEILRCPCTQSQKVR